MFKFKFRKTKYIGALFKEEPKQWGLRGDPYLWKEMKKHFNKIPLPKTDKELKTLIEQTFELITDKPITINKHFIIERFCHGGMSSGGISPEFWKEKAIPLIISRYKEPYKSINTDSLDGLAKLDELYFPEEKIDWPEPWWYLDLNLEIRTGIQKELNSEIGPKHPLWGLKPVVIGKTGANDDVIVHLKDGRFACVHLVWHGKIDPLPDKYPSSKIFENAENLQVYINEEADEYT